MRICPLRLVSKVVRHRLAKVVAVSPDLNVSASSRNVRPLFQNVNEVRGQFHQNSLCACVYRWTGRIRQLRVKLSECLRSVQYRVVRVRVISAETILAIRSFVRNANRICEKTSRKARLLEQLAEIR